MHNPTLIFSLLAALLLASPLSAAEISTLSLQNELSDFKASGNHQFAPKTTARAEAYLGAAMLAEEQQKQQEAQTAMFTASEKLTEAKDTSAGFRQQYSKLLELRDDARSAIQALSTSSEATSNPVAQQQLDDANQMMEQAIQSREKGDLNKTQEQITAAKTTYQSALKSALPWLTELAASEVSRAAACGAKGYTPQTYQAAKNLLAELEASQNGVTPNLPRHPVEALYLAREAKHLCQQVKLWRRSKGSHEDNSIKAQVFRQQLANSLNMEVSTNPLLVSVAGKDILLNIEKLKKELAAERKARADDTIKLKKRHEAKLQSSLNSQKQTLMQERSNLVSTIKEANSAKLARETYDKKRQQKLVALFKKGDVKILVNLDGSLLIRLTALKFPPSRSKIDAKYYDLLAELKGALKIYSDRSVRIEGHTDNQGDVKPNQLLSLKRAEAVREFLIASGSDGAQLKAIGFGEVYPIASNDYAQGRDLNRRIDVIIDAPK